VAKVEAAHQQASKVGKHPGGMAPLQQPNQMGDQNQHQRNAQDVGQDGGGKEIGGKGSEKGATAGRLGPREDLQPAVEHGLGKIPLELARGGDRDRRDAEIGLAAIDAGQQIPHRRLDDKFRLHVYLPGDLLPKLDAKAGEPAVFFDDKGPDQARGDAQLFFLHLGRRDGGDRAEQESEKDSFHAHHPAKPISEQNEAGTSI